ncbi:Cytochrome c, mono-and diheme variants [Aquiflexum balticum DSM 16537]|uniref:Cytochrome c, mono-and diheme variants n=1 Tax=Aquiflexum balticum DSM 16537 TaxID=758820 RepID=A0A1W2GXZ8_9BACT|nr:cytochrome c [Aquiflexum balticum]SMD41489.1 Cytochrome c, mono-and diheme variants [Aquiflexum balticum DSM 16537]
MNLKLTATYLILYFLFSSCQPQSSGKENTLANIKDTKVLQYAIEGKILYENLCANCHQKDGSGLGKLIPPLFESDYMLEDIGRTIRIIKFGQEGEIIVNGQIYNQAMPANPKLTDMEIAQIVTYLYNIWGNKEGVIDANTVGEYLKTQN